MTGSARRGSRAGSYRNERERKHPGGAEGQKGTSAEETVWTGFLPEQKPKLGAACPVPQSRTGSKVQGGPVCPQQCGAVGRQEPWALVQSLLLSDYLRRESPITSRPQSHSLRSELMGLNYLQAHCHHSPRFMSALLKAISISLSPVPERTCSRGSVGPEEVACLGWSPVCPFSSCGTRVVDSCAPGLSPPPQMVTGKTRLRDH